MPAYPIHGSQICHTKRTSSSFCYVLAREFLRQLAWEGGAMRLLPSNGLGSIYVEGRRVDRRSTCHPDMPTDVSRWEDWGWSKLNQGRLLLGGLWGLRCPLRRIYIHMMTVPLQDAERGGLYWEGHGEDSTTTSESLTSETQAILDYSVDFGTGIWLHFGNFWLCYGAWSRVW